MINLNWDGDQWYVANQRIQWGWRQPKQFTGNLVGDIILLFRYSAQCTIRGPIILVALWSLGNWTPRQAIQVDCTGVCIAERKFIFQIA